MPLSGDDGASVNKTRSLKDKSYGDFQPSSVPVAPDGGPVPGLALEGPDRPEPTEDNFVCLRGPCRHFWHLVCSAGEGNPKGTFAALGVPEPREHHLTCTAHPGTETQLSFDEIVYECNRWDPVTASEMADTERRRRLYQIKRAAEEPIEEVDDLEGDEGEER